MLTIILVLQKHSQLERIVIESQTAIALLFCHSSNEWLQLELPVNSIPLKKEMTACACFKETQYPWKY